MRCYEGVVFSEEITAPFYFFNCTKRKELLMKKQNSSVNLALSSMFLALAFVMPFLTGQIPQIGSMLCPMHIPVILCGFVCGAAWGLVVGFIAPLLRSFTLGMPVLFPVAFAMAFELAAYGFMSGFLYRKLPENKVNIYLSLIVAMIAGRLVWGVIQLCCVGFDISKFNLSAFWTGAVANAIPGIAIQVLLIPVLVIALEKVNKTS